MQQNVRFQLRNDSVVNWLNSTTPLLPGEPGYAVDTNDLRIGGSNGLPWNQLVSITNRPGPTGLKGPTGPSGGPVGPTGPGAAVYFPPTPSSFQIGNQWVQNGLTGNIQWTSVAISSTGQYQLASSASNLYSSSDYGVTFTLNNVYQPANPGPTGTFSTTFTGVAISQSGQYQTAVAYNGYIYYSSNFGAFWNISTAPLQPQLWNVVAIVSSGQRQLAVTDNVGLWVSQDYGYSFVQSTSLPSGQFNSVATSLTGQYQTVVGNSGRVYTSSNYGATFSSVSALSTGNWNSVSISSTGQYQTIVGYSEIPTVFISSDFGATWTNTTPSQPGTPGPWASVSISSSGQYQVIVAVPGYIYTSQNFGNTWLLKGTYSQWAGSSMSSTGQYQTAVSSNGQLWISNTDLAGATGPIGPRGLSVIPAYPTSSLIGKTWSTSTLNNITANASMLNIAISSTGQHQTALVAIGNVVGKVIAYTSGDYGVTWTDAIDPNGVGGGLAGITAGWGNWSINSMSASGQYQLLSTVANDYVSAGVYRSTDFGYSWNSTTLVTSAYDLATSGDGKTSIAYDISGGNLYMSSDYGATWRTIRSGLSGAYSIALSHTGKCISIVRLNGIVFYSQDDGSSWNEAGTVTSAFYSSSIAMSASGQYQVIGYSTSGTKYKLFLSSDYGATWTVANNSPVINWTKVSISSTGQYLSATGLTSTPNSYLYTSSDFGNQWTLNTSMSGLNSSILYGMSVAMSSNAQYQAIVGYNSGYAYSCNVDFGTNNGGGGGAGPTGYKGATGSAGPTGPSGVTLTGIATPVAGDNGGRSFSIQAPDSVTASSILIASVMVPETGTPTSASWLTSANITGTRPLYFTFTGTTPIAAPSSLQIAWVVTRL